MKRILQNLIGGLAGAVALTVIHEAVRRIDENAPRVDLVGEEGINKVMDSIGAEKLEGQSLYVAALTSDIISNGIYYSTIGSAKKGRLLIRGITCGVAAGMGALSLTKKLGLDDTPVNRSTRTKWMTIGYYITGGLVTALTIRALRSK